MKKLIKYLLFSIVSVNGYAQSPGGIANPTIWIKAGAQTATSMSTTGLINSGSIGNITTVGSAATLNSSTDLVNYNPKMVFNGTSSRYSITNPYAASVSITDFGVGVTAKTSLYGTFLSGDSQYFGLAFQNSGTDDMTCWRAGVATNAGVGNVYGIFGIAQPNGTASDNRRTINGLQTTYVDAAFASTNGGDICIGSYISSGTNLYDGDIYEIIEYTSALSTAEMNKINTYLALKYGISLEATVDYVSSAGTILWDASTHGTYVNNIIGIGTDYAGSGLRVAQAKSYPNGHIAVYKGTLKSLNSDNSSLNAVADDNFILLGSNGLSGYVAHAYGSDATVNARSAEIWDIEVTGTGITKFNVNTANGFPGCTPKYVMVSTDPTFATVDHYYAITGDAATITFDVTDADYLAIAVQQNSPGGVTGAKAWFKADAGVTSTSGDGSNVSAWSDQSGNDYDLAQTADGNRPQYYSTTASKLLNFNPTIDFDGSTNYLKNTSAVFAATSDFSFIALATDEATATGYKTLFASDDAADNFSFYKQGGAATNNGWALYWADAGTRNDLFPAGGIGFSPSGGSNGYYNGVNYTSNANTVNIVPQIAATTGQVGVGLIPLNYLDGKQYTHPVDTETDANYFQGLSIGGEVATGVEPWTGRIPEFIAYNSQLTSAQMQRVNTYLAIKYGITLGQGGTNPNIFANDANYNYLASDASVIWDATTNTSYKYHIAGIGRDDLSGLDQEQSKSQNPGFQPVIGNASELATSNLTHTGSFAADKSFLVWGCDNASTNFATAYVFGVNNSRMTRIWKVQESGTVGTVKVAIPSNEIRSASPPTLLVSNDATFDGSDTQTAMGTEFIGGVNYYTATVNFITGQFFTFANYQASPGGVTGAKTWLKADAGVTSSGDGTDVSVWLDVSGNTYDVSQSTVGDRPEYYNTTASKLINFNPTIDYTNNELLENNTPLFAATSAYSFIAVATDEATSTGYNTLYACDDVTNDWSFYKQGGATGDNGWNMWISGGGPRETNSRAIGFSPSGGANGYYNGVNFTSNSNTQRIQPQIAAITGTISGVVYPISYIDGYAYNVEAYTNTDADYFQMLGIGAEVSCSNCEPWTGRIPEFIAFDSQLTAAQMKRVNSYLAIKYGTTLGQGGTNPNIFANDANYDYQASDATVIWDATTNTTYKYHIAGIGRDDLSGLDQEQSQSQNPNLQPIIGNASEVNSSNAAHSGSFTADKSFEVWGCDGASTSFATAFAFGTCTYRMTRVWKVQETGTVGTVKVAVKICDFVGNVIDPYLLVSSDATFDGTDTRTAMTKESIGGVYYYTATTDFTNGQFFTFAGFLASPGGISSNLELWLKADGCTTSAGGDGTNVSTWFDASSNGYDVTQTADGNRPQIYTSTSSKLINYNPTIYFDGSTNYLKNTTALFAATSAYSFIAAATDESTTNGYNTLYACDNSANHWSFYKQNGATGDNGWNMWTSGGGPYDTNPQGIGFSATGGANGYYNGVNYTSNASTKTITPQVSAMTGTISGAVYPISYIDGHSANYSAFTNTDANYFQSFGIGAEVACAGCEPWFGRIPEFIAYSNNLTAAEMTIENTYLAIKYGITLGQGGTNPTLFANEANYDYQNTTGTVIWDATANTGFKYNIAGIAKDNTEGLEQKISTSSNGTPDIVTISLDNDFTSANNDFTARPTSFNSDLASLLWGTDNGATTFTQTYNTSFDHRMVRKWKTQATNFNDQVYVKFADEEIANSTSYYLIANTTSAETGWTEMDAARSEAAGNTVTFGPVSLGAANYFSISNFSLNPLPIELLSFNAVMESKTVNVLWKTASEINNDYFTVERSIDGVNFVTIGVISSKANGGNSTSVLSYSLDDSDVKPGVYYYRLKQTDFDGVFTYSNIDAVEIKENPDFTFNILPNPNDGAEFNLIIHAEKNQEIVVVIRNVLGQELYTKVIITEQDGDALYAIDLNQKLNAGVYFITATSNDKVYGKRLIVN